MSVSFLMFIKRLLAIATGAIVGLALTLSVAQAFDPWNQRLYPGAPNGTTPMVQKVAATSTMTWNYTDSVGWNGVAGVISRALDTGSSDQESLGNVYNSFLAGENRGHITIRRVEPGEAPDSLNNLVSSAVVDAQCGASWATACVYLFNPVPNLPSYYRAAAMMVWSERDAKAVFRHENNHALARSCDQYKGGCPRASDGGYDSAIVCTGNPDTLMDCGGAARTATQYDYETFKLAYPPTTIFLQVQVPPPVEWGGCNSNSHGVWCYNNFDGLWHWTVWLSTYQQEWRSNGGPWFCISGCP